MRVTLTLTTTGRRSGEARDVTLYGFGDEEALVIVGSLGGAARDPAWVHNLRAEPHATIRTGREVTRVRAREAVGDERERLWKMVTEDSPMYAGFQRRTKRLIPLFVLEAADATGAL